MFETNDEMIIEKMYNSLNDSVKHQIANVIQTACIISQNSLNDATALGIPQSKYFRLACDLSFCIDSVFSAYIDSNNMSGLTYGEKKTGHGRPVIRYEIIDGSIAFHIKKERNPRKLPSAAKFRCKEMADNQQLFLKFPDLPQEEAINMVVTFNHKHFDLQYVQIGVSNYDYTGWLRRFNLMPYIQPEMVEYMQKEYEPEVKEEFIEKVNKQYKLEMRK